MKVSGNVVLYIVKKVESYGHEGSTAATKTASRPLDYVNLTIHDAYCRGRSTRPNRALTPTVFATPKPQQKEVFYMGQCTSVCQGVNATENVGDASLAIVVFIIVNSVLSVHIIWRNGWRKNASKCTDLHVTVQFFYGDYVPESPYWGGAMAPLPKPHLPRHSGAASLPRLPRGLNRPPMFVSR